MEPRAIGRFLSRLSGQGAHVRALCELGRSATGAEALKAFGYGRPLQIDYELDGQPKRAVLRQVKRNGFGRERDSDRVADVWQDFHAFNQLPRHTRAVALAILTPEGEMESIGHAQDVLLLTDFRPGQPYAADLLRMAETNDYTDLDRQRVEALADYLADIHAVQHEDPLLWRRRLRDLIGHGEGIMGLTDSYPADYAPAPADSLRELEGLANAWRWRLKPLAKRLSQVHGDFHPYNLLFADGVNFHVLDRSRGEWGEPADDVSCLTINFLFFSLQRSGKLEGALSDLHDHFWERYLRRRPDPALQDVIQPWLAWRALVLASPQWYPTIGEAARRKLLYFARHVMTLERYDPGRVNAYLEPETSA